MSRRRCRPVPSVFCERGEQANQPWAEHRPPESDTGEPVSPGDRVVKKKDHRGDPAVVEVLPPETEASIYGNTMEGGAVNVAFPGYLEDSPGN